MPRGLIDLKLPKLVEATKKQQEELTLDSPHSPAMGHALRNSQSSTSSDQPSPSSPTFSARCHSRFPSSNSSLASSPSPLIRESMDGFGTPKRPLTEVKEEPHEREEEHEAMYDLSDGRDGIYDFSVKPLDVEHESAKGETLPYPSEYDLADDIQPDTDFASTHSAKRRRGELTLNSLGSRFGTKLPSFSRKWRHRQTGKTISIADSLEQPRHSRANSTRAPSRAGSVVEVPESQDPQLPPTPARSVSGDNPEDSPTLPIDIQKANSSTEEVDAEGQTATTPLLPPIMTDFPPHLKEIPYQSPLQSPTVADPESAYSVHTPIMGPQVVGLPSPPLSAKPSMASFHRQRGLSTPSAEYPSRLNADLNDHWAVKLGHANFIINPEPYVPEHSDLAACKKLRSDWDLARCNFMKHLMRTGENWGTTSKTYKLTEEKWAEIDACWKCNSDLCNARMTDNGYETALSMSQSSVTEPAPPMKLPSLNGPKSEGKFPKLGDEDIVGPMEQVAQLPQPRPLKRTGFFKFFNIFGRSIKERGSPL